MAENDTFMTDWKLYKTPILSIVVPSTARLINTGREWLKNGGSGNQKRMDRKATKLRRGSTYCQDRMDVLRLGTGDNDVRLTPARRG